MKKALSTGLVLALFLTLAPLAHGAEIKQGSPCKKVKATTNVGRTVFTCVKVSGKLIWRSTGTIKDPKTSPAVAGRNYEIGWICDPVADANGAKDSKGVEIVCNKGSDGVWAWRSRAEVGNPDKKDSTPIQNVIDYSPIAGNPCKNANEVLVNSAGVELTCGVGQDKLQFWYAGDQTPKAALFGNENIRASMIAFPRPQKHKCVIEPGQEYQYYRIGRAFAVDPFDPKHMFAAVEWTGFYESFDGGSTWKPASMEGLLADMKKADNTICFKEIPGVKFDPYTKGRVYLLFGGTGSVAGKKWQARGSGLYVSNDSGKNWEFLTTPDMTSFTGTLEIDPKNPSVLYLGTGAIPVSNFPGDPISSFVTKGIVYKSTNAGKTWTELNTGWGKQTRVYKIRIDPNNSQNLIIAVFQQRSGQEDTANVMPAGTGLKPGFYQSTDGGETWKAFGTSTEHQLSVVDPAISADATSYIFTPQTGNYIDSYYSNDGGKTFNVLPGKELLLTTFAPGSNTVAYAIQKASASMSSDLFVKTSDGGRTWTVIGNTPVGLQYNNSALADRSHERPYYMTFDPTNSSTIYITAAGGKIARSTDLGVSWTILTTYKDFPAMNVPAK